MASQNNYLNQASVDKLVLNVGPYRLLSITDWWALPIGGHYRLLDLTEANGVLRGPTESDGVRRRRPDALSLRGIVLHCMAWH